MTDLLEIPKNPDKGVFTLKHEGKYYGAITGDTSVFVSPVVFDSPLKASNHARSLKRKNKINLSIKKQNNVDATKNTYKIARENCFYTEAEMASRTDLKFREVWLIVNLEGKYASQILSNNNVVKYVNKKEKAQSFKTYEEAQTHLKTLDTVVRRGHTLRRFFEEIK
jgi:hypothetical protein